MSIIEHAVAYAEHDFRVHPLVPGTKLPMLDEWQVKASNDLAVIRPWFEATPNANIGIATGEGLCVIDIDRKGDVNGFKTLEALAARGKELPACPISVTPTGGRHLWFRNTPGLRNCAGRTKGGRGLGPGIDFRGEGGYIVAPPSYWNGTERGKVVLPGGGPYRWLVKPRDIPPPPLPEWAVAMLRPRKITRQTITFRRQGHDASTTLDRIANFVARTAEGQRNSVLYWATLEAIREGADPLVVRDRLTEAAHACGLGALETARTIQSAIRSASEA